VGWAADEIAADSAMTTLKSPKSRLQEHTQRTTGDRPLYRLLEAVGPDHEKQFRIEVVVDGRVLGVGEGLSRRIAETSAAAEALEVLRTERQAARAARAAAAAEVRQADRAIGALDAAEPAIEAAAIDAGDALSEPGGSEVVLGPGSTEDPAPTPAPAPDAGTTEGPNPDPGPDPDASAGS
jgi:hypothetical protein